MAGAACGLFFCFGMFIFQTINVGVGLPCICPFEEGVPRALLLCGTFGAVIFGSFFIVNTCCANSECHGIFFKGLVGIIIIAYIGFLIAATALTFNNFSRWSAGNQTNCGCFNYTFGMVIAHWVLFILAAIIHCATTCSS